MAGPSRTLGLLAVLLVARTARADEPVGAHEPRLTREPAEITTVASAFDKDDPFDLNLVLGFTQTWKHAHVRRETQAVAPNGASGGFIPATTDIATYTTTSSSLIVGADVGLYHDLALILRLPILLSWTQALEDLNGSSATAAQLLADPSDPSGRPLFGVPFTSPTRSGLDYVAAGLDWGIFNQRRDASKPTWVVGVEGRLAIGPPLHACNAAAAPQCPDPATGAPRSPGSSRGMDALLVKSVWSRRFGPVEPYAGIWAQAEFAQDRSDFGRWNPSTNLERTPPFVGTFALGAEVVPAEQREQSQRLSADFGVRGTYHSPGRDYSELFDALGSSPAASLRSPNPSQYMAGPPGTGGKPTSIANPNAEQVYFSGITESQGYASVTASLSGTWQAGAYIKFTVGADFTYVQNHLVTAADPCTPGTTSAAMAGPCVADGVVQGAPNPDHRDVIDAPGHRFSIDDTTVVDLWVRGVVMF
jgi:hypothetical protein